MTSDRRTRPQLAYEDADFLASDDARPLRILAEYLEPLARFRRAGIRDTIVFFGSARLTPDGPLGRFYADARELARLITHWSKSLTSHAHRYVICSGGGGGIMEAANRGASMMPVERQSDSTSVCRTSNIQTHTLRASCCSSFATSSCASCGSLT